MAQIEKKYLSSHVDWLHWKNQYEKREWIGLNSVSAPIHYPCLAVIATIPSIVWYETRVIYVYEDDFKPDVIEGDLTGLVHTDAPKQVKTGFVGIVRADGSIEVHEDSPDRPLGDFSSFEKKE